MRFRVHIPDAKADARHQERVAEERGKLRDKKREREERRKSGPRVPRGTVNLSTLGYRLMMYIDPSAQPDVQARPGRSRFDAIEEACEPLIYLGRSSQYVVLTPAPMKYQLGTRIRILIVRGPKPFRRATAALTLGEYGQTYDVHLPEPTDWVETECGDAILDYAREIAAFDKAPSPTETEASNQQVGAAREPDVLSQVARLGELHVAGVLTDAEFATKKAELLARL